MSQYKKTSRADLYSSESEVEPDSGEFLGYGNMDFEFVEVDYEDKTEEIDRSKSEDIEIERRENTSEKNDEDEEYEFPLFGGSGETKLARTEEEDEEVEFPLFGGDRGRSTNRSIMRVSLREASEERIINKRPENYYFAKYTEVEKEQFEMVAITYEHIILNSKIKDTDSHPYRVIDLKEYNTKIEKIEALEAVKKLKRKRPSKKARKNRVACKERKSERAKLEKQIEEEKLAKLKKKMFHKRGGKKNKKKAAAPAQPAKPKYRTE